MGSKVTRTLRRAQCGAAEKVLEGLKRAAADSDVDWQAACGIASVKFLAIGIQDMAVTVAQELAAEPPERRMECVAAMIEGVESAKVWFASR